MSEGKGKTSFFGKRKRFLTFCPPKESDTFHRYFWVLLLLTLTFLFSLQAFALEVKKSSLSSSIEALLRNPKLKGSKWGIEIARVKNKEVLYRKNEKAPFLPASNIKLFTTAAALCELGPGYRFITSLYARGIDCRT